MLDLALHGLPHLTRDLDVVARARLHGEGMTDGRERIAQLVRQHRQELVLAAVGLPQGFLGSPPVVDVDNGSEPTRDGAGRIALRERAGQLPAVGAVHAAETILGFNGCPVWRARCHNRSLCAMSSGCMKATYPWPSSDSIDVPQYSAARGDR